MFPFCHLVSLIEEPWSRGAPALIAIIEYDPAHKPDPRRIHVIAPPEHVDESFYKLCRMVQEQIEDDHVERRHPWSLGAHFHVGDAVGMSADTVLQVLRLDAFDLKAYVYGED